MTRMRRATHLYCHKCKTNLHDYGQQNCDKCNADLTVDGSRCCLNTIIEEQENTLRFKLNKLFMNICCFCCLNLYD